VEDAFSCAIEGAINGKVNVVDDAVSILVASVKKKTSWRGERTIYIAGEEKKLAGEEKRLAGEEEK